MIQSIDNYYILYYKIGNNDVKIKIEKNYNLNAIWSGDVTNDVVSYKIHAENGNQIYTSENSIIELTYKIIKPFLRDVKLKQIGL